MTARVWNAWRSPDCPRITSDRELTQSPLRSEDKSNDFDGTEVALKTVSLRSGKAIYKRILPSPEAISVRQRGAVWKDNSEARSRTPFSQTSPLICVWRAKGIHRYKGTRQWPAVSVPLFHDVSPKMRLTCEQTCTLWLPTRLKDQRAAWIGARRQGDLWSWELFRKVEYVPSAVTWYIG